MSDKAAFMEMLNIAEEDDGMESIRTLFGDFVGDFDVAKMFQKPEIQRLLASDVLKDAIDASEIPLLQNLYAEAYVQYAVQRSFRLGYDGAFYLSIFASVGLLLAIFGYLVYGVISKWKAREATKEEKKRLRQLKKENAETQRRLKQNKSN